MKTWFPVLLIVALLSGIAGAAIGSELTKESIERNAKAEGVVYRDKKTDVLRFYNPCDSIKIVKFTR